MIVTWNIILLSKTCFTSETPQSMLLDVVPSGYAVLHVVRQWVPGSWSIASNLLPTTFELQLLRVDAAGTGSSTPFTVVHVYRPPWMSRYRPSSTSWRTSSPWSWPTAVATYLSVATWTVRVQMTHVTMPSWQSASSQSATHNANLLDMFAASNTKLVRCHFHSWRLSVRPLSDYRRHRGTHSEAHRHWVITKHQFRRCHEFREWSSQVSAIRSTCWKPTSTSWTPS